MATKTQYNPNAVLNERLIASGASKTVYALVAPEIEQAKRALAFDPNPALEQCREAWTGKQDAYHNEFFDLWHEWSSRVVSLDRSLFPFYYPCAGASEAIRQIIFDNAVISNARAIHVFDGDYEGYRAMAEAAHCEFRAHRREEWNAVAQKMGPHDLFFISAPSAIDGNVWADLNDFLSVMPKKSVVVDATYVGAVPESSIEARFNLNAPSVSAVVFSLSKPFGAYYDRIGGVFMKQESQALFGNRWFKNLQSIRLGALLMKRYGVFYMATEYGALQKQETQKVSEALGFELTPSDVFILATGAENGSDLSNYLARAGNVRLCVTPSMASVIGTVGKAI